MSYNNKKRAYTLAEIMLVILVLSIIFAAMAPIFTKRKISQYTGKYNVWSYAERVNFDAFFDPGDPAYSAQLFFGITPTDARAVTSEFAPLSKLIIRAGEVTSNNVQQRHIQFRYGRTDTDKDGEFAGSWFVNRKNMLLGGGFPKLVPDESNGARDNVAIGYGALNNLSTDKSNVAIGYRALASTLSNEYNVAVGYQAGTSNKQNRNVFIGYNAGSKSVANATVAIGYNAGHGSSGNPQNVFIGAYSGGGSETSTSTTKPGAYNTAIGYKALGKIQTGSSNIAIGYNALGNLTTGINNIAIGYNACSELTTQSNKVCIGYNSGPKKKNQTTINGSTFRKSEGYNYQNNGSAYLLWNSNGTGSAKDDSVERVYIGGTPRNFAGDAILELHNPQNKNFDMASTNESDFAGSVTTIVNGNLIVRGRPYFTVGKTLHHFHNNIVSNIPAPNFSKGEKYSVEHMVRYYGFKNNSASTSPYVKCTTNSMTYTWDQKCPQFTTRNIIETPEEEPEYDPCPDLCMDCQMAAERAHNDPRFNKDAYDMCGEHDRQCGTASCPRHQYESQMSDRRLKNITEPFTGGLKELKALKVYNFTFKNDKTKHPQVGVMAQELQRVFPNAVFQDENGYLKIRWDELFYSTVNAIKELDKKIVALVKRTVKVETQISKLEKENVELKNQIESLTARVNKLKAQ